MCISEKNNIWQDYAIKISVQIELSIISVYFKWEHFKNVTLEQSILWFGGMQRTAQHKLAKRHLKEYYQGIFISSPYNWEESGTKWLWNIVLEIRSKV